MTTFKIPYRAEIQTESQIMCVLKYQVIETKEGKMRKETKKQKEMQQCTAADLQLGI